MKRLCNKLNKILSEKKEGFVDELNRLIEENVFAKGGEMMWDREIAIHYGCDGIKMRELVLTTDLTEFCPSDDPEEHPGIVVKYKENKIHTLEDVRKLLIDMQKTAKEKMSTLSNDKENLWYFSGQYDCIKEILSKL